MSPFPLICSFKGDYGLKVFVVDAEDDMATVAKTAADCLAGVVVQKVDLGRLRVRQQGAAEPLPRDITVTQAKFIKLETVEIYEEAV